MLVLSDSRNIYTMVTQRKVCSMTSFKNQDLRDPVPNGQYSQTNILFLVPEADVTDNEKTDL